MAGEPVVAERVEKHYGDVSALRGVSLSVGAGEVFALVGPNGSGKTTLVRCLTGTTEPDAGSIQLLGGAPTDADRTRIGLLPQAFSPPDRLSARELIAYYAGLYDGARPVDGVLEAVGMADSAGVRFAAISGGQQRRTLVGTALVNDPDVLFLDEPTAGIDPSGRRTVWGLIGDLASTGATVFLTSHSMAEVETLADRIGVLVDGLLVEVGTPEELLAALGTENRLYVRTDAVDQVGGTIAGHEVVRDDSGLRMDGVDASEVGAVVEALLAAGVEVGAITWRRPDLESVYLELTDREPDAPIRSRGGPIE